MGSMPKWQLIIHFLVLKARALEAHRTCMDFEGDRRSQHQERFSSWLITPKTYSQKSNSFGLLLPLSKHVFPADII
jgi:hypothetical protein